jgi:hypothetical protein
MCCKQCKQCKECSWCISCNDCVNLIDGCHDDGLLPNMQYFEGLGSELECIVCMETINSDYWLCDKCSHVVCRECIEQWLKNKPKKKRTCPMCRTVLA